MGGPATKKRQHEVIDLTVSPAPPTKHRRVQDVDVPIYLPTPTATQSSQPSSSSYVIPDDADDVFVDEIAPGYDTRIEELGLQYGTLETKIVGCRFYDGFVTMGEMVILIREPDNAYDSNAIRVDNVRHEKIGHIPRTVAEKLAPFMDDRLLAIEAVASGPKSYYDCPIQLRLYGPNDITQRNAIKARMKSLRLPTKELIQFEQEERRRFKANAEAEKTRQKELARLRTKAQQAAFAASSHTWAPAPTQGNGSALQPSQSLDEIMQGAERFNPRQDFDQMVEKFGIKEEDLAKLPMAEQPTSLLAKLLPFQRQGLQWLLDKENVVFPAKGAKDAVQLHKWSDTPGYVTNLATHHAQKKIPELASGGILADDMGLGKTIQIISLIAADRSLYKPKRNARSTLILAPLGVMSNWSRQIEQHIRQEHALSVLTYHGAKRTQIDPKVIENYDVVITTYDTAAQEYWGSTKKGATAAPVPRPSGLFSVHWRRVVLDEGHIIRNPATKKSQAAYQLVARSRWVLSGTPIVNTLKDLYSMIKFLRVTGGVEQWDIFNQAIARPVIQGDEYGQFLLQTLMQSICLRRKKDMSFIDLKLPELTEYVQRISFADHEKEQYAALYAEAKGQCDAVQNGRSSQRTIKAYNHLFEVLLRLRQVCNHWKLCGEGRIELPEAVGEALDLTPENRAALLEMLQLRTDSQDDCPICIETLSNRDPVITACTHVFCYACAERFIETQHKCPMCRATLESVAQLLRQPQESEKAEPAFDIKESSSKVEALLSILRASQSKEGTKTVVFSQWTSFLDIVQVQLEKNGIPFCRIDGTMRSPQRDAAIKQLEEDGECKVMLASLGVCSVGLNLVAANQVILSDTWWAPAIEDQAVDRVHRLGQTRPCTVFRLVMEDSIEEEVLKIQEDKRKLMQLAFADKDGGKGGKKTNARLADIARILGK